MTPTPSLAVTDGAAVPPRRGALSPVREFVTGIKLLLRGFAAYGRDPGLLVLGLLPAVIAFALFTTALILLIAFIGDLSADVTWWANGWSSGIRDTIHLFAGIGLIGVAVFLAVLTFTAITLAIGDPFYEKIAERIDDRLGGTAGLVSPPFWSELWRGIRDAVRLAVISIAIGIPLFIAGFLPVVGQTVVPVIGALTGGWFLAIELTGVAFSRRGYGLRQRREVLRRNRALATGFGTAVFCCFLIPLGAILVMPAAVAGSATLVSRRALGESGA